MATSLIMSNYLEQQLINHMFRNIPYTPPANVYLALYETDPNENGTGLEVGITGDRGQGYARVLCPTFTIANGLASTTEMTFPMATRNWGTVAHMGIKDAASGGNLLFYGSLSETLTVSITNTVRAYPTIRLLGDANYGWGAGVANSILDFVLNGVSFSPPGFSVYLALGRSIILDDYANFTSWTEVNATGYARQNVIGWTAPVDGAITNTVVITFTNNAPANWGSISNIALFNSSSAGDLLLWGRLSTPRIVYLGDGFRFQIGDIVVSLDIPEDTY